MLSAVKISKLHGTPHPVIRWNQMTNSRAPWGIREPLGCPSAFFEPWPQFIFAFNMTLDLLEQGLESHCLVTLLAPLALFQTGTGFIRVEQPHDSPLNLPADDGAAAHHESCRGNPATNDWIPSADLVSQSKPKISNYLILRCCIFMRGSSYVWPTLSSGYSHLPQTRPERRLSKPTSPQQRHPIWRIPLRPPV